MVIVEQIDLKLETVNSRQDVSYKSLNLMTPISVPVLTKREQLGMLNNVV